MTYEKQIVLRTLKQVQDKIANLIEHEESKLKNDNSLEDSAIKNTIRHLECFDYVLALVAKDNGIKIGFEKKD